MSNPIFVGGNIRQNDKVGPQSDHYWIEINMDKTITSTENHTQRCIKWHLYTGSVFSMLMMSWT